MTNRTVLIGAAIVAVAILLAAAAMIYFSPYQTCVRDAVGMRTGDTTYVSGTAQWVTYTQKSAEIVCSRR